MKYADKRAEGIALLRQHARESVPAKGTVGAHRDLQSAMAALLEEFRCEFDTQGTRYWLHPGTELYFSTAPGDHIDPYMLTVYVELARHEYLSRQELHFGYEDRL